MCGELEAGRVGRAHGLDGSFYVTRPKPRLLAPGTSVTIEGRAREIVRRAGADERPIVRLADVHTREAAEALRGLPLTVAPADAPALGPDEWWAHELEGCEVHDGERQVGMVVRVIELPSCEALEVAAPDEDWVLLVPMVKDAIRAVDPAAGRIDVDMSFVEA
ncbi:MAG TPA: ribosome maturation factor RimM [Solirubrobacteraceae bacterium]|nr:ribosome maturation factor RimM [Solirubrobacteraceae bacterium]